MLVADIQEILGIPRDSIALGETRNMVFRIKALVEKSIANEREACAKLCEDEICLCCWDEGSQEAAEHLAHEIRERSNRLA